jgi:hypothetical protein
MQSIVTSLKPAQKEVHKTAQDQDMIEVPKRAKLDRVAEGKQFDLPEVEPAEQNK